jgi:hypothetical protein
VLPGREGTSFTAVVRLKIPRRRFSPFTARGLCYSVPDSR